MENKGDDLIFSTGTVVYANRGIIGISEELSVYGGYDNGIEEEELTKEELIELADFMIERWQSFKVSFGCLQQSKIQKLVDELNGIFGTVKSFYYHGAENYKITIPLGCSGGILPIYKIIDFTGFELIEQALTQDAEKNPVITIIVREISGGDRDE